MRATRVLRRARALFPRRPHSLAGQVFALQLLVIVVLALLMAAVFVREVHFRATREAYDRSRAVSETFAHAPGTVAAMRSRDPSAVLQPSAEAAREKADVTYVVAFDPAGIRWSHPDPSLIGKHVSGDFSRARAGKPFQEVFDSSRFGEAVETTSPVLDGRHHIVGFVSAGIRLRSINDVFVGELPVLGGLFAVALALAVVGTALVSRRLRSQTHGLGPAGMTRMYEHHDAVLHAVREGVVIVGPDGRLLLVNDEARRLLGLNGEEVTDRDVHEVGMAPGIASLLASGHAANDEMRAVGDRLVAFNQRPVSEDGEGRQGSVATLRDTTELRELANRAEFARDRLQLLYDASVRIGTTLDTVRTAEELAEIAVPRFADYVSVELLEPVLRGEEPTLAGTEMRRVTARGIREDHPLLPIGELIDFLPGSPLADAVLTGRAQLQTDLTDSAEWGMHAPERAREVVDFGIHSLVSVPLRARGVVLGMADFWRSEQPPYDAEDVSFAEELAARAAVAVDNARRFTREHSMAVTLQRSLLPRALPEQSGLEVAYRYLPTKTGVGGDWFDVIPLSGARFALVVGDVVGHGVHAAATMGRLRTAVHNFSALDLAPDELLAHLDELVARMDEDEDNAESPGGDDPAVTGATCLYAVYDQVSGVCAVARAGHPGPALVTPDGVASYPDIPGSPPLGLGSGLPVEKTDLVLPPDSLFVLFTDGLVKDRERDIGTGLALLRDTLAVPGRGPEETCGAVMDRLLVPEPGDDVTLLVTRTRRMSPERIAEWDIPSDPAAVSRLRGEVLAQLDAWGLDDLSYTTGLITSELVTNAIRYGAPPARLRLLHDVSGLICEVTDSNSTAPHLRRAKSSDEGGRGLFLVAQFADRWGTRYLNRGKVIWTEQLLTDGDREAGEQDADALLDQWSDEDLG
ncbi:SpoIIE family protein phosphatase [Streptomyces sp. NPDC001255]|uniref:SpoIIE family protein phosphatase n=1 Tax=Streptomyces sp. NPDC001255 TaxID=3364550 RepID=UPI0036B274B3